MSKAARNQLMNRLKGELESRLSSKQAQQEEGAQAAAVQKLRIQQPKVYGKVNTAAATTTTTATFHHHHHHHHHSPIES